MSELRTWRGVWALLIVVACGSSGNGGSNGGGSGGADANTSEGGGNGGFGQGAWSGIEIESKASDYIACVPDDPCIACVLQKCSNAAAESFGAGWQHQDFSGNACNERLSCVCACDPNTWSCLDNCPNLSNECRLELDPILTCVGDGCLPICCGFISSPNCPI